MSWRDVFFQRRLEEDEIRTALAKVFAVAENSIELQRGWASLAEIDEGIRLVCGIHTHPGDFPCMLEIIPLEKALMPAAIFPAIGALCEYLDCCALDMREDDRSNWWTYICGVDNYQRVKVDPDKADKEPIQLEIIENQGKIAAEDQDLD